MIVQISANLLAILMLMSVVIGAGLMYALVMAGEAAEAAKAARKPHENEHNK